MSESTFARLSDRIRDKIAPGIKVDDCWDWIACLSDNGYGKVGFRGQSWYAHRAVYTLLVGEIPDGLVIDHLCRNRRCCNPNHLRTCTNRDNLLAPGSLSPSAIQARRTHCPQGHPLSGENLYVYQGQRDCKTCRRERTRQSIARHRVA